MLAAALVTPAPLSAGIAFACGYAVGALPVAWLLAWRWRDVDLRDFGGGTGAIDAVRVAGVGVALVAGLTELLKGGAVGLVAGWLGGHTGWFTASAMAGCVTGDAFPIGFRRGGRGLVPLVSGLLFALPIAGLICAVIALPVAFLTRMRGRVYDLSVVVAVPLGLMLGTLDWRSLAPGTAIVVVLVVRSSLRRAASRRAVTVTTARSATIVDQPADRAQEP
ncbi:MAG TPA: glycerol-3-phosphate acyltransferase [Candidatus Binatia bacterium]|nr:glycerol-3-phosphate acyltransferase [Candidatus Binatia bacterium]